MRAVASITKPAEDITTTIERTITRILDGRQSGVKIPLQPLEINSQSSTQPIVSKISSAKLLLTLRSFQKDENAQFKSEKQRQAVEAVLNRQKDVLMILPTGGGKTLLYLLPTLLKKGRTTAVVILMIAVTQDLIDRCNKSGISSAEWSSTSTPWQVFSLSRWSKLQARRFTIICRHCTMRKSRQGWCLTSVTLHLLREAFVHACKIWWAVDVPLLLLTAVGIILVERMGGRVNPPSGNAFSRRFQ